MPSSSRTQTVTPRTFLIKDRKIGYVFLTSVLLFLIGMILLGIFALNIKKKTISPNQTLYRTVSKNYLFGSVVSLVLSLVCILICLVPYLRIFGPRSSTFLFVFLGLNLIGIMGDIYLITHPFNFCAEGLMYSDYFKRCVPICAPGSKLNDSLTCVPGCDDDHPCEEGILCVGGGCCKNKTDTQCGGVCCPQGATCTKDNKCCSKESLCPNGTCCDIYGVCDPSTNMCGVYCPIGYKWCKPGELCVSISVDDPTYKDFMSSYQDTVVVGSTAYACTVVNANCQLNIEHPNYYPQTDDFYPAFGLPQDKDLKDKIFKRVMSDWDEGTWKKDLADNVPNKDHEGIYCGPVSQPYQFVRFPMVPNGEGHVCSYEKCIENAVPNVTTNVSIQRDASNDKAYCVYANAMSQSVNRNRNGNEDHSTYTVTYYDKDNVFQKELRTMSGSVVPNDKVNTNKVPNFYQPSCNAFNGCPGNCPVEGSSVCECKDDIGFINEKTTTNTCQIENGKGVCKPDPRGKDSPYPRCDKDESCQTLIENINKLDVHFGIGDCANNITSTSWAPGEPKHCCGKEWTMDNNGRCTLKSEMQHFKDDYCEPHFSGTIPMMKWEGSNVKSAGACGDFHDGYFAYTGLYCCMRDVDPKNIDYDGKCTPGRPINQRDTTGGFLKKDWILTGRGGGSEFDPNDKGSNGCHYSPGKVEDNMKNVINQANQYSKDEYGS